MTTRQTILDKALDRFARHGYLGTSLQQIADDVGTSKSSILYHFPSKDAVLDAAMAPALDALDALVDELPKVREQPETAVPELVAAFVDALMAHRAAVTVFITQRGALHDVPAIIRGTEIVNRIANALVHEQPEQGPLLRLSIGLAGVAFILGDALDELPDHPQHEAKREILIDTLLELCRFETTDCPVDAAPAEAAANERGTR